MSIFINPNHLNNTTPIGLTTPMNIDDMNNDKEDSKTIKKLDQADITSTVSLKQLLRDCQGLAKTHKLCVHISHHSVNRYVSVFHVPSGIHLQTQDLEHALRDINDYGTSILSMAFAFLVSSVLPTMRHIQILGARSIILSPTITLFDLAEGRVAYNVSFPHGLLPSLPNGVELTHASTHDLWCIWYEFERDVKQVVSYSEKGFSEDWQQYLVDSFTGSSRWQLALPSPGVHVTQLSVTDAYRTYTLHLAR